MTGTTADAGGVVVARRQLSYRDGLTLLVEITARLNHAQLGGMARKAYRSKQRKSIAAGGALSVRVLDVIQPPERIGGGGVVVAR